LARALAPTASRAKRSWSEEVCLKRCRFASKGGRLRAFMQSTLLHTAGSVCAHVNATARDYQGVTTPTRDNTPCCHREPAGSGSSFEGGWQAHSDVRAGAYASRAILKF
jgi:hypothetical protein